MGGLDGVVSPIAGRACDGSNLSPLNERAVNPTFGSAKALWASSTSRLRIGRTLSAKRPSLTAFLARLPEGGWLFDWDSALPNLGCSGSAVAANVGSTSGLPRTAAEVLCRSSRPPWAKPAREQVQQILKNRTIIQSPRPHGQATKAARRSVQLQGMVGEGSPSISSSRSTAITE